MAPESLVGLIVAFAIVIDNLAEALSIGELIRSQSPQDRCGAIWRILRWTGLIGISLFGSAMGGGGMFCLVVTDLLPEAEERQYQQSSALAVAAGLTAIFVTGHIG